MFGSRSGTAPVEVLALHGWRKNHSDLQKVTEHLNAIAVDLPGFGASPQPSAVWGAAEYAAAVARLLTDVDAPVVVVGHSFGGRVALNLAADYPQLVRSLVLTGVPLIRRPATAKKSSVSYKAVKLANRIGVLSDERFEREKRKRGSADYRAAEGVMRDIFVKLVNESYEQQLQAVKCHVELVWGENDTEAPLAQAREAERMLADASLTIVPGGTHWLPVENPQPIRDAIKRSLA